MEPYLNFCRYEGFVVIGEVTGFVGMDKDFVLTLLCFVAVEKVVPITLFLLICLGIGAAIFRLEVMILFNV